MESKDYEKIIAEHQAQIKQSQEIIDSFQDLSNKHVLEIVQIEAQVKELEEALEEIREVCISHDTHCNSNAGAIDWVAEKALNKSKARRES